MNSQPDPPHDRRTSSYRIEDFDYELPKELIAQTPLAERSSSKLLVIHRQSARLEDRNFSHILEYFMPVDVLVLIGTGPAVVGRIGLGMHRIRLALQNSALELFKYFRCRSGEFKPAFGFIKSDFVSAFFPLIQRIQRCN